jgi:uncharacterized protein YutE (UPF0331/DUF86 family)
VENKISSVSKYLNILKTYGRLTQSHIRNDITLKGAVERYLYLAIQATIELAESIVAMKKYRKPASYRESFDILCEEKFISASMREKLVRMTGFRNIIAHDYEKVDFGIVYDSLKKNLADIERFIKAAKEKLKIR